MTLTINSELDLVKILNNVYKEHQKYIDMLFDPIATHELLESNEVLRDNFVEHDVYEEFRWLTI